MFRSGTTWVNGSMGKMMDCVDWVMRFATITNDDERFPAAIRFEPQLNKWTCWPLTLVHATTRFRQSLHRFGGRCFPCFWIFPFWFLYLTRQSSSILFALSSKKKNKRFPWRLCNCLFIDALAVLWPVMRLCTSTFREPEQKSSPEHATEVPSTVNDSILIQSSEMLLFKPLTSKNIKELFKNLARIARNLRQGSLKDFGGSTTWRRILRGHRAIDSTHSIDIDIQLKWWRRVIRTCWWKTLGSFHWFWHPPVGCCVRWPRELLLILWRANGFRILALNRCFNRRRVLSDGNGTSSGYLNRRGKHSISKETRAGRPASSEWFKTQSNFQTTRFIHQFID